MLRYSIRQYHRTAKSLLTFVIVNCGTLIACQCAAQGPTQLLASQAGGATTASLPDSQGTTAASATGNASRDYRERAISSLPLARLTPAAKDRISRIVERPSLYRHLPSQSIDCDPDLFLFIARHPEVLVGIWDVMGVTQVKTERLDDFRIRAVDGSGTTCTVDLVYGDRATHVFVADGFYDGKLVANPLQGKGVFILRTSFETNAVGLTTVHGTLDCFLQFDNLGADLIAKTFGQLIGKTADNNFRETAKFLAQIGLTARENPDGLADLASRLPQVDAKTRSAFVEAIYEANRRDEIRIRSRSAVRAAERPVQDATTR